MFDWLFGRKPAVEGTSTPAKTKGMLWLETASDEVFHATMTALWKEVKELPRYPSERDAKNASVYAGAIMSRIKKLDRTRLNDDQKRRLASIIFVTFPRVVSELETRLLDLDARDYAVEEFGETIVDLISRHLDPLPRKIPIPNQLTEVSSQDEKEAVETVGSPASDEKLRAVKKLAREAYRLAISAEDKFFAEQAANAYIPDSVRLLTGLIHAPDDMKIEANELFIRQLNVLETQLNTIIRRTTTTSLSEMKAHTEFLESKNERLELPKM